MFGLTEDFGGKPWSWVHHMAVVLAAAVNDPPAILFWHEHEPNGQWWEASRPYLTLRRIAAPREIFGRPLVHAAHRADVVRLLALIECGGVYIDSDVWCLKPFAGLRHAGFWMGRQGGHYGLCNATMGGEAGSAFAKAWFESYRSFRSKGRDRYWDEHSVRLPLRLARGYRESVTVFPKDHFFHPLWGQLHKVFTPDRHGKQYLANSYSVHLWESVCWHWLADLDADAIDRTSEIGQRLDALGVL